MSRPVTVLQACAVMALVGSLTRAVSQEPTRRLEVPRRAEGAAGVLDWVFDRVASGSDAFESEVFSEQVTASLQQLAERLHRMELDSLDDLVSLGFRGASALPGSLEPLVVSGSSGSADGFLAQRDVSVASDDGEAEEALDREEWRRSLLRLRSTFRSMDKVKFKTFRIGRDASVVGRFTARVLLELDGRESGSGAFAQIRSIWDTTWAPRDKEWRLEGVARVTFERASARERTFQDVTVDALGDVEAHERQMTHGVAYWRTRIDSTSGIDLYGHQGIAVGDIDGDGLEDIYVPQPAGLPNRLFRNLGERGRPGARFEEIARAAGVDVLDNTGGALLIDLDNDGDLDLVAVTSPEVLLFENSGKGIFRRQKRSGLESIELAGASTLGAACADYDLDGDLDLYVFSYVFWDGGASKRSSTYPYPYHDANNGAPNFLFRNEGGLRFRDVTRQVGLAQNNLRFSLAASWADYDDDGDPDLYVANDFGKNNLYRNEGEGRFRDVAEELGVEDTGNGMSVTWEDVDADGRLDLYVGNMWSSAGSRIAGQPEFEANRLRDLYLRMSRGNSLFRNLGEGKFEEVSGAAGAQFARWSWSAQFLDIEGDGLEDLYVVNGFISGPKKDDL